MFFDNRKEARMATKAVLVQYKTALLEHQRRIKFMNRVDILAVVFSAGLAKDLSHRVASSTALAIDQAICKLHRLEKHLGLTEAEIRQAKLEFGLTENWPSMRKETQ